MSFGSNWKNTAALKQPDYLVNSPDAIQKHPEFPQVQQAAAVGASNVTQPIASGASNAGSGIIGVSNTPNLGSLKLGEGNYGNGVGVQSPISSGGTNAVGHVPTSTEVDAQAKGGSSSIGSSIGNMAVSGISSVVSNLAQQRADQSAADYTNKLGEWKAQGKYWFDPNQDLMPDIQGYLKEMPSETKALEEGTLFGGSTGDNAAASLAFNPAGLVNGAFGENAGMVTYAEEEGVEGAIQGFQSGGWIGAIGGAAIGVVEALFGYSSAKKHDEENKRRALEEADRAMKQWQFNSNARLAQQQAQYAEAYRQERMANRTKEKAEKEAKNTKSANAINLRRAQMIQALSSAGSVSDSFRKQQQARWA